LSAWCGSLIFVAIIRYPNGHEHTERFTDIDTFREWVTAFEGNLEAEH
jgi:hypothetical protein